MSTLLRLDKLLTELDAGSRSQVKNMISKGRVMVNDIPAKRPEQKIDPDKDVIRLDHRILNYARYEYYMLNKPAGCVSATQDNLHQTVVELITESTRKDLFPVGRLDIDTEGLLLITNDGELAHNLLSPKKHVDKTYYAKVNGKVTKQDAAKFAAGLDIGETEPTRPAELEILLAGNESEVNITITEGKFHQIKRMFEAVDKEVVYLRRIRMGSLVLDDTLATGSYRRLTDMELEQLKGQDK